MQGGTLAGDRYQLRRATMVDLIRTAYNIDFRDEVYGGPSWLDYDRFEVIAKTKPGTRPATLRLMLPDVAGRSLPSGSENADATGAWLFAQDGQGKSENQCGCGQLRSIGVSEHSATRCRGYATTTFNAAT